MQLQLLNHACGTIQDMSPQRKEHKYTHRA